MSANESSLPARPSLEQLRKQAKDRLAALRASDPATRLADAQFDVARQYGFESWPGLVAHVSTLDPRASQARITSPVNRYLGTLDRGRAIDFWRDVLGFEMRGSAADGPVDLVSGAARVRLGERDWPPDFSGQGTRPGSAVVFFETDDIEALQSAIRRRGGDPTEPENVNWLKMRVFQIRDPDGHILWFGQSYHRDSPARPRGMLRQVMPELPMHNVPAGVRHYRDVLGFRVNYEQSDIAVLDRDDVRVLLVARSPRHAGIGSAYFYVRDADALYSELLGRGADVQAEPTSQPWGLREFSVLDPEGNRLTFGQTFE